MTKPRRGDSTAFSDEASPRVDTNEALQAHLLGGVSRTFALTIPELPSALSAVVSNNYLLCRIVDTIEDEPTLSAAQKRYFCERFVRVVEGNAPANPFANELAPLLSAATIPAEHRLIAESERVIQLTHGFTEAQQIALRRCVRIMGEGMVRFQENPSPHGLTDQGELDRYCYHVAGIVGETLTALFCEYSSAMAAQRERMMRLSVSFGQGLQMTNILKDIWDDRARGACWLPRDLFLAAGFDLQDLHPGQFSGGFGTGLAQLIGIARGHLDNAMRYTLLVPSDETGIRNFCLWAIGMAVLTLRKLNRHRDFSSTSQVKISRRSVKATVLTSRFSAGSDRLLRSFYGLAKTRLPAVPPRFV